MSEAAEYDFDMDDDDELTRYLAQYLWEDSLTWASAEDVEKRIRQFYRDLN